MRVNLQIITYYLSLNCSLLFFHVFPHGSVQINTVSVDAIWNIYSEKNECTGLIFSHCFNKANLNS